ncbi:MAG: hypothetical protein AAGA18_07150 [Verrucomicrobiota bacterium]
MTEHISPDLQAALICEDVRMEANGGNTLVGVINIIAAPKLPIRVIKLCVFTRWCSGRGEFLQKTRILDIDEEHEIASAEAPFRLKNTENHATNVNVFGGMEFRKEGDYPVEICLENDLKLRFTLKIVKMSAPQPHHG